MVAFEIINRLPAGCVAELLGELRMGNRATYRAAMELVAGRRKLRAAFLEKKPLPERHEWMAQELSKKANNDLATEILQGWLFACRKPMLINFLDSIGAPHDGEGVLEDLPPEPARPVLESAVQTALNKYPAWEVFLYLNLFCEMDIADWPNLREIAEAISVHTKADSPSAETPPDEQ